jgi:hypothetical protein
MYFDAEYDMVYDSIVKARGKLLGNHVISCRDIVCKYVIPKIDEMLPCIEDSAFKARLDIFRRDITKAYKASERHALFETLLTGLGAYARVVAIARQSPRNWELEDD